MKKSAVGTQSQRLHQAIRHRQAQEKQELRQAILTAAGTLFLEQGYERFSLRKVAERIGYSPTTIYLYFRDKDDLLFTVVDEGFERFSQLLATAAESQEDPWERLIALGRAYVAFGLQHPVYYQLMFMQRTDFLTHRPADESRRALQAFGCCSRPYSKLLMPECCDQGMERANAASFLLSPGRGLVCQQILAESRL